MEDLIINENILIPASELEVQYARSGGPGGQNVNKVNTKTTLVWDISKSTAIYPTAMSRLKLLAGNRLTEAGLLQITSQVHREQARNLQACRDRLRQLILQALIPPKIRRPTKPTQGSQRRRVENKRIESQKKQNRSTHWD